MANYKIPNLPSARAYKEETADFWEVQSLTNPGLFVSQIQISKVISMELDEINADGIENSDDLVNEGDENRNGLNDVFAELQRRIVFTNNKYPFVFSKYSMKIEEESSFKKNIYLFLLLCTRMNMTTQKVQNGIDGTLLFEHICAYVSKKFFGESSDSFVFGTAEPGNFETKVNDMIKRIGEGQKFSNPNNNSPTKNDDAIDVVVWKEFSDKRKGKLIGFGQCKTGTTSWRDGMHKLKPKDFCKNWLRESPIFEPIPLIFICDTMNEDFNYNSTQTGYLVFNRFRIIEHIDEGLDDNVKSEINTWLEGATSALDIKN